MLSAIVHQMRHCQVLPWYSHSSAGTYASARDISHTNSFSWHQWVTLCQAVQHSLDFSLVMLHITSSACLPVSSFWFWVWFWDQRRLVGWPSLVLITGVITNWSMVNHVLPPLFWDSHMTSPAPVPVVVSVASLLPPATLWPVEQTVSTCITHAKESLSHAGCYPGSTVQD